MKTVNEKNSNISTTIGRIQEKEFNLSRLDDSSLEEETVSHKTNDSSRSGGSSKFSSFKTSEPIFEEDEMKGLQWKGLDDMIPEEADEASSVGGDEITPRRLEEDQEEIARINEELNSARNAKKGFHETQPINHKKNLHLSHISSVNNSRDETHFMSPTSAGNISIPVLHLSKVKRAA